jgi:hypothetical protein
MLKARSTKLVRPARGRLAKPAGRLNAGKPPPGETFREFIRTLEKLDRGSAGSRSSTKVEGPR